MYDYIYIFIYTTKRKSGRRKGDEYDSKPIVFVYEKSAKMIAISGFAC